MPNIKGVKKRVKQIEKATRKNAPFKANLKKQVKNVNKSEKVKPEDVKNTHKAIDKAAKKGIITKKTAARKKSRIAKKINK